MKRIAGLLVCMSLILTLYSVADINVSADSACEHIILDPAEYINPVRGEENNKDGIKIVSGSGGLDDVLQPLYYRFDLSVLEKYRVTSAKLFLDSTNIRAPLSVYDCTHEDIKSLSDMNYITMPVPVGTTAVVSYSMSSVFPVKSDKYPGIKDGVFEHCIDFDEYIEKMRAEDRRDIVFMMYTDWDKTTVHFSRHPKLYLTVEPLEYSINSRSVSGSALKYGKNIKATYSVSNFKTTEIQPFAVISYFDNGKLVDMAVERYTIMPGERKDEIQVSMTVPASSDYGNCYAKAFLWDNALPGLIKETTMEILPEYEIDSKNVRVIGRGEDTYYGRSCNWPQAGIEFIFSGTKAQVYVSHISQEGNAYFNVLVDGKENPERLRIDSSGWYTLAENLEPGNHTVRFVRSDEGHLRHVYISKVRSNAERIVPTANRSRRIEFIGDSYTSGYGNLGTLDDTYSESLSDSRRSYAGFAMEMLNADGNLIAHSGKGVLLNIVGKPHYTLPVQYLNADVSLNGTPGKWDFTEFVPQVIVVFLGTNDFDGLGKTDKYTTDDFSVKYEEFLKTIREKNPDAHIVACSKMSGGMEKEIDAVVNKLKGSDTKIHRFVFTTFKGSGCDGHPSVAEAEVMARELVDAIENLWVE